MTHARPLRVTFVVPDLAAGGAERHVVTLVHELDPDVVEARVVCLGAPGQLFDDVARRVPATAYGHAKRQAVRSVVRLALELRRTRADVVVLRGYSAETVGRLAAVLAGRPRAVVWVHNSFDLERRGFVRGVVDRVLDRATTGYFGVAQQQRRYLLEELGYPEHKVRIIHNGVDPQIFEPSADPYDRTRVRAELGVDGGDVLIGVMAALRPEKDHESLLHAMALVVARAPQARLVLVGDGVLRPRIEQLVDELGLTGHVVMTGYRSDIPELLRAVDVSALSSWSECLPMSVLEAMAAAVPVVSTDVGGVAEAVADGVTGYLVPPRDAARLADRLLDLVSDAHLRRQLGEAARVRVLERFTLEHSVRTTARALQEVAGHDRPSSRRPLSLTVVMDETGVGGVEVVTLNMFKALDRSEVTPHLVCLREPGPLATDFEDAGVEVRSLGRRGWHDLRTVPRLVRELRRSRTDVVLVAHHHRASLVLGRVAARLAGVRTTMVAAHGMDLVPLGQRVLPRTTVASLRLVSALVVLAPSQADYLHLYEGVGRSPSSRTKEVVIPNGIPMPPASVASDRARARALLDLPSEAFVVGIIARLAEGKGHGTLLQAFALLLRTHPAARLVVVGGGDLERQLVHRAHELGIFESVLFTGVRRDVAAIMPSLDVACVPSVHEAAPITLIEAMAAGIPVVASRCGAIPDMMSDGEQGRLVPVGDVASLASALEALAADPEGRRRMGLNARRRAEREFDIRDTARKYESLIRELVRR